MAKRTLVRRADNAARISYDDSTSELIFERYNTETAAWEESLKINLLAKRITFIADVDDDLKLNFGRTNKFAQRYDSSTDSWVLSDEVNDVDLFRLRRNTVVGYTVPVAPQDCINQSMAADSTGTKFASSVKIRVDGRYLKKIRLRASWTASNTDSVTEVRVVGTSSGTIVSVSGNTGSDEEAEGTTFSDGELVYVEVAVTTASATAGATTTLTYAIVEFIYEMA